MLVVSFVLVILIFLFVLKSVKILNEDQRAALFRLGKFENIVGPGIVLIFPFIDRLVLLDLNSKIPGWRVLSQEQINAEVKKITLQEVE